MGTVKMRVSSPQVSMRVDSPAVNMAVNDRTVINVIGSGQEFQVDETLTFKDGVLSVNTTDKVEADNSLPITSAAVYVTVGNIEVLLKTI